MDLIKIGKFIAELRKENGLTQEQLGDKIGVTNKTISRWETGTYLPPADAMLAMGEVFNVSVNEILSGSRLTESEYKKAAEENLMQTIKASSFSLKDKVEFFKKKWLKEHIAIMVFIGICIIAVFIADFALTGQGFRSNRCNNLGITVQPSCLSGAPIFLIYDCCVV